MNSFVNTGVMTFMLKDFKKTNNLSIAVLGIPRSGTTSIAAGLENAGISFGQNLSNVKEDQYFKKAIQSIDSQIEIKKYFEDRRKAQPNQMIGCKFPEAYKKLENLIELENHVNIAIFRDPFSLALRNSKSMFENFDFSFNRAVENYMSYYQKIASVGKKNNLILVSYEKILSQSYETFHQIFSVLLNSDQVKVKAKQAAEKIILNDSKYLNESNLRPKYNIDLAPLKKNILRGWIFYQASPNRIINLEVYYKSKVIKEINNQDLRIDLFEKKIHPNGNCGFNFNLNNFDYHEKIDINQLSLKIKNTNFYLSKRSSNSKNS